MLDASQIRATAGKTVLLHETSVGFAAGRFHMIMGPNGAGKSTLLKVLAGELVPAQGGVSLNGQLLDRFTKKELARSRAVLSQHYDLAFPVPVIEVVRMGRYPHAGVLGRSEEDALVWQCMEAMNVQDLADRDYSTLSGGEA
ncbi:MAG: ATP-binding cassette domain-containing protein [Chitinophagaceae bacterium]|nr:MAG: ATP-binding cassette domain-containing protein [Chitinophagaceae bacterium]